MQEARGAMLAWLGSAWRSLGGAPPPRRHRAATEGSSTGGRAGALLAAALRCVSPAEAGDCLTAAALAGTRSSRNLAARLRNETRWKERSRRE